MTGITHLKTKTKQTKNQKKFLCKGDVKQQRHTKDSKVKFDKKSYQHNNISNDNYFSGNKYKYSKNNNNDY